MTRTIRAGAVVCGVVAVLAAGCRDRSTPVAAAPTHPPHAAVATKRPEPCPVTVTPAAAEKVKGHIADVQTDDELAGKPLYLRVRVVAGGCQGFMHKLDLDLTATAGDKVFDVAGVKVVVAARQVELLQGAVVDFGEDDGKVGFKVENPNFKGDAAAKSMAALTGDKKAE